MAKEFRYNNKNNYLNDLTALNLNMHQPVEQGWGFTLYITVMQKHLGSVSVDSELNKQTSFNITLPIVAYEMHTNVNEVQKSILI